MTATTAEQEAAWENYRAKVARFKDLIEADGASIDDFVEVEEAHRELRRTFEVAPALPPLTERQAVEAIRTAHAMLLGIITIGSFEHVNPGPVEHDATCALIHEAHQVLADALRRA